MKKFFLIVLLFSSLVFSQTPNRNMVVEYEVFNNTSAPNTLNATLFVNNDQTRYYEKYSTQKFITNEKEAQRTIVRPKFVFEPWTMYNHKKKELLFFETISTNIFFVEDTYNDLKWDVKEETREISGYSCLKAITNFRGREWEVWFAPEIPVPYGPWKLHGLPGLILEAKDSTGMYTIRAFKIDFKRDEIFDKEFKDTYESKNKKLVSYKQFFADYQEFYDNLRKRMIAETGGEFTPQPRKGKELKFEWEK